MGDGEGQVALAEVLMKSEKVDWVRVISLLEGASKKGVLLSFYHLGRIIGNGLGNVDANCVNGVFYMRQWIDSTRWHEIHLEKASRAMENEDYDRAMVHYLVSAEMGFENAQSNAAVLIDDGRASARHVRIGSDKVEPYGYALNLYLRAANQGNIDARVRVGDLYYLGNTWNMTSNGGITSLNEKGSTGFSLSKLPLLVSGLLTGMNSSPNYPQAIAHYSAAAEGEFSHSSLAMFNLGWMYEYGLGVQRDYHLAKRWYDMSLITNPAAY